MMNGKMIYEKLLNKFNVNNYIDCANALRESGDRKNAEEIGRIGIILDTPNLYGKEGRMYWDKKLYREKEKNIRKKNQSIEIPCGGRTFSTSDGEDKYWGTCSASYTIPQVAGYFALAKQISPNITYDEFVKICRETCISKEKRKILSPKNMIKKIEERDIELIT